MQSFAFSFRFDWVVVQVLLHLSWESNASNLELFQLLWRRRCASQNDSIVQHYVFFLSTRCHTTSLCTIDWRTIVRVSLDGVRAFPEVPFSASVSPGSTSFVVQKVRAWLHDCCSS